MNVTPAVALVALVLVVAPLTHVSAAEPTAQGSVADAHKRLQAAREALAKAVQRIEKDPPATADLDAAHAAVGTLKEAIDAGAAHEASDLDYAKAALAARKELRTQRDYVDDRRAKVHIHNHRRTLDAALVTLNERMRKTENKDAESKAFEEARAAVTAAKKTLDEARPFGKQDPKWRRSSGSAADGSRTGRSIRPATRRPAIVRARASS